MLTLAQSTLDGIMLGGLYAIMAIGLTLIFGVVRIVNFAHGAFVMLAGYCAWILFERTGVDPYFSALIVTPAFFVVGVLLYRILLKRLAAHGLLPQVLFTLGIAIILESGVLALEGPQPQTVQMSYSLSVVRLGPLVVPETRLIAFLLALLGTAILYGVLQRTDFGRAARASAVDPIGSQLVGIDPERVHALAMGVGIACAGLAGVILLPILSVSPIVGTDYSFLAFLIIVLGGLGSFSGALLGGILVGITETVGATYLNGSLAHMLTFVLFVFLVLFRPHGLLARRGLV